MRSILNDGAFQRFQRDGARLDPNYYDASRCHSRWKAAAGGIFENFAAANPSAGVRRLN